MCIFILIYSLTKIQIIPDNRSILAENSYFYKNIPMNKSN